MWVQNIIANKRMQRKKLPQKAGFSCFPSQEKKGYILFDIEILLTINIVNEALSCQLSSCDHAVPPIIIRTLSF